MLDVGTGSGLLALGALTLNPHLGAVGTELDAQAIVEKSLSIAADVCIYTNHHIEVLEA